MIFKKDSKGNTIYFIFETFGNGYIVNDINIQQKLSNIESYREFILSYKPPIIIPIIVIALIVSLPLYFMTNYNGDPRDTGVIISLSLYILSVLTYLLKIKSIVKNCEIITKDERQAILSNKPSE